MSRTDRTVAMVYPSLGHGPTRNHATDYGHPAHRGFAASVGADDIVVRFRRLPEPVRDTILTDAYSALASRIPHRDVYLVENDAVLYVAPVIKLRYPESTVIHLAASDRLLGHVFARRPDDTFLGAVKRRGNRLVDTPLLRELLVRCCDGAIAVSALARDRLRSFVPPGFPIHVVNPYVQPRSYTSLASVEPDLRSNVAVMVGEWRDHKGVELLVDAWPRVRERHSGARLRLVGLRMPDEYANVPGVTIRGFVDTLAAEFESASLYVHPARLEAFGVSIVEAMRAGLPAVVTETTGARSAVESVDRSLVVPPTAEALATRVSEYFASDVGARRALSRASRRASDRYDEAMKTGEFRAAFGDFVPLAGDRGPETIDAR